MNSQKGTPKSLLEAVNNALEEVCDENNEQLDVLIANHVKDFIRQKLSVAYFKAAKNPEALEILKELKQNLD